MTPADNPFLTFPMTEPLPGTAPIIRCLNLLYVIMDTGTGLVARLYGRIMHQHATRAPSSATAKSERRFWRVAKAICHVMELQNKLEANFAYRGEPARPTRPACPTRLAKPPTDPTEQLHPIEQRHPVEQPHPSKPAIPRYRKRKAPTFEQYFAGRTLGGIVENIRRRIGLAGPLGPWFDDLLPTPQTAPPQPAEPAAPPPITIRPGILRTAAIPDPAAPPPQDRPPKAPT